MSEQPSLFQKVLWSAKLHIHTHGKDVDILLRPPQETNIAYRKFRCAVDRSVLKENMAVRQIQRRKGADVAGCTDAHPNSIGIWQACRALNGVLNGRFLVGNARSKRSSIVYFIFYPAREKPARRANRSGITATGLPATAPRLGLLLRALTII